MGLIYTFFVFYVGPLCKSGLDTAFFVRIVGFAIHIVDSTLVSFCLND